MNVMNNNNNNNSVKFFIIYVPSQQIQGQLQTQHSADTNNDKHYIKLKLNGGKHWRRNTLMPRSEQTSKQSNNNNNNNNNSTYSHQVTALR
jgi:hypothetical protein